MHRQKQLIQCNLYDEAEDEHLPDASSPGGAAGPAVPLTLFV